MNRALKAGVVACGLIAVGCASRMTALNSDMPDEMSGLPLGKYVLEQIDVSGTSIDEAKLREKILSDNSLRGVFGGSSEDEQTLPVNVRVSVIKKEANGGVAKVNNVFALFTLTLWPYVSADEWEYAVKVETVTGKHTMGVTILDRDWFSISPIGWLPVPGWAGERGDQATIGSFHSAQIIAGIREACRDLTSDYEAFGKDRQKYLEQIDVSRSNAAFAKFLQTKDDSSRIALLEKVCNKSVLSTHQKEIAAVYASTQSAKLKEVLLEKVDANTMDQLAYDKMQIPYWGKMTDQRKLALIYREGNSSLSESDKKALVNKITDEKILVSMVTQSNKNDKEGLYVKEAAARKALYEKMDQKTLVALAKATLSDGDIGGRWREGGASSIYNAILIGSYIKDVNSKQEVILEAVDILSGIRRRWDSFWGEDDRRYGCEIITLAFANLSGETKKAAAKKNRNLWPEMSVQFTDKKVASDLAVSFIEEALATKKVGDVKDAWNKYNGAIYEESVFESIAVKYPLLRDEALVRIKDSTAKNHALAAIKAEQERLAVLRKQKLAKVVEIAEKNADEMRLLFSYVKINSDQKKRVKQITMGRPFYLKNVKVWNENVSAPKGTKRIMLRADLEGSSQFFMMEADFNGDYKASVKGLKDFAQTSVFGYAIQGVEYTHDVYLEAMIATGKSAKDFVAFLDEHNISDEMLDEILSQKESVIRRFAKDEELDFPTSGGVSKGKVGRLSEALKATGKLKKEMNELDAAKKEVRNAWADLKKEVKNGVDNAVKR